MLHCNTMHGANWKQPECPGQEQGTVRLLVAVAWSFKEPRATTAGGGVWRRMKRAKYRLVRLQSPLYTYISMCVGLGKKHGGHSFVIQDNVLFRFLIFLKISIFEEARITRHNYLFICVWTKVARVGERAGRAEINSIPATFHALEILTWGPSSEAGPLIQW